MKDGVDEREGCLKREDVWLRGFYDFYDVFYWAFFFDMSIVSYEDFFVNKLFFLE
jgi:hypothetical protein